MSCPKCNGVVKEQVSIRGFWFWKKKVVTTFCTICDFQNTHEFKLSSDDKKIEMQDRESNVGLERIDRLNTKTHKEFVNSDKAYEYTRHKR